MVWDATQLQRVNGYGLGNPWDQVWKETHAASPQGPKDFELHFGYTAISEDGSTLVVGAPRDAQLTVDSGVEPIDVIPGGGGDPGITILPTGAAFVFKWNSGTSQFDFLVKLLPDPSGAETFGAAVDCNYDGTVLIIGAPNAGFTPTYPATGRSTGPITGAFYIFTWNGSSYTKEKFIPTTFTPSDTTQVGAGSKVAITRAGDRAYVSGPGSLLWEYVHTAGWAENGIVPISGRARTFDIDSTGTRMVVGNPSTGFIGDPGSVDILEYSAGTWDYVDTLTPDSFDGTYDSIGLWNSISDDGNRVLSSASSAYLFEKPGIAWNGADQVEFLMFNYFGSFVQGGLLGAESYSRPDWINYNISQLSVPTNLSRSGLVATVTTLIDDQIISFGKDADADRKRWGWTTWYRRNSAIGDWSRIDSDWIQPAGFLNSDTHTPSDPHGHPWSGFPLTAQSGDGTIHVMPSLEDGSLNPSGSGLEHDHIGQVWVFQLPLVTLTTPVENLQYWGSVVNLA